ncbi:uncharacterized protein EDB91DRAFT_1346111 [Suillus paluster]|uniref:uncharacterized protein n=1 Tax=Suillus paluster TaxID=48578 RepID=UPI001B85C86F|nr:uncharacterized protein EDB91DRAFT_1346111 [Suillus paluster]KAG1744117.1 hypothetical protein EDB91DRAFT_1346111 [Suillus paluster]
MLCMFGRLNTRRRANQSPPIISFTILGSVPTIPLTDVVSLIVYLIWNSTSVIAFAILGVIMIARINAMYQRSRKVLVFLVVTFLAVNIVNDVTSAITMRDTSGEELILSNTYQCTTSSEGDVPLLSSINWILATVWEILALCLAVWIAVKHLRELRGQSAGGIIGDCFTELIKTHVIYFASVVAVSCLELVYFFSPILADPYSLTTLIYGCICGFFRIVQMFVLGPRLILSIREYNAKQVADADAGTAMTSIAFQAGVQASNSSSV